METRKFLCSGSIKMDLFALISMVFKIFTNYYLESRGIKWSLPAWLVFMKRRDGWIVKCSLQLTVITVLVSLLSSLELMDESSKDKQEFAVKLKYDHLYKSIVVSLFLLAGVKYSTPFLIAPWLNFTLKNFFTLEVASFVKYFYETPDRDLLSFIIFITLATTIIIMQINWWILICNFYSFLWNEVFERFTIRKTNKILVPAYGNVYEGVKEKVN